MRLRDRKKKMGGKLSQRMKLSHALRATRSGCGATWGRGAVQQMHVMQVELPGSDLACRFMISAL
jgi:hypothetical protein